MKHIKKVSFIIILILLPLAIIAQESENTKCRVLKTEIAESYNGECKKGLAHGKGIATGLDRYEGSFKKGLPHGKGEYQYHDLAIYKGDWRKGLRDGSGEYSFKIGGKDSLIVGYWKDDKYIGKSRSENEYQITLRRGIEMYSFQKLTDTDNRIEIYFERNTLRYIPADLLLTTSSGYRTSYGSNIVIEDIKYPFSGSIRYSVLNKLGTSRVNCELEYTIEKPGKWQIVLRN